MGLFGFGKKEDDKTPQEAQQAPAADASQEMKKCEMCGQEKPASDGKMMMEGTAFRCNDCAKKSEDDDHGEVCEFC